MRSVRKRTGRGGRDVLCHCEILSLMLYEGGSVCVECFKY